MKLNDRGNSILSPLNQCVPGYHSVYIYDNSLIGGVGIKHNAGRYLGTIHIVFVRKVPYLYTFNKLFLSTAQDIPVRAAQSNFFRE
jgi:hypothetical protein